MPSFINAMQLTYLPAGSGDLLKWVADDATLCSFTATDEAANTVQMAIRQMNGMVPAAPATNCDGITDTELDAADTNLSLLITWSGGAAAAVTPIGQVFDVVVGKDATLPLPNGQLFDLTRLGGMSVMR
jgi:hypothetical protein